MLLWTSRQFVGRLYGMDKEDLQNCKTSLQKEFGSPSRRSILVLHTRIPASNFNFGAPLIGQWNRPVSPSLDHFLNFSKID